jgi:tRNA dimethylallyltransferase
VRVLPALLPVIAVVGPTAVGKTAVAIELADRLEGRAEILSADSVQIYRGLNIGSAKPSAEERRRARFELIDIADTDQSYTLADYQRDAIAAYESVRGRGSLSILCGGTGLYIRALTQPLGIPRVPPDPELRNRWNSFAAEHGITALHQALAERDPSTASRLHVNDVRRVVRALEVLDHTGRRLSDWHKEDQASGAALLPEVMMFGLNRDRPSLYEAIDRRVDQMMLDGFEQEVRQLRAAGYARALHSMRCLGYNELNAYVDGEATLSECVESIKLHTRQFARRQLIWFRADPRITWIDTEGVTAERIADRIMSLATQKSEGAEGP